MLLRADLRPAGESETIAAGNGPSIHIRSRTPDRAIHRHRHGQRPPEPRPRIFPRVDRRPSDRLERSHRRLLHRIHHPRFRELSCRRRLAQRHLHPGLLKISSPGRGRRGLARFLDRRRYDGFASRRIRDRVRNFPAASRWADRAGLRTSGKSWFSAFL